MTSTQVLIVGAGPTGLAAAAALAKLGVSFRIVEKNDARSTTSKALGVQSGTLACLDAAHIHSPAGGQGMNTGIQDALNLAYKIRRVVDGRLPIETLENYERERRPVTLNVVRSTDFVFKLALSKENASIAFVRRHVLPMLASSTFVLRLVVGAVSEMAIAKKEIARYFNYRHGV